MFKFGLVVFLILSCLIFLFDSNAKSQWYFAALYWAIFAKLLAEKLLGRTMKYLHYLNLPTNPEAEKSRNLVLLLFLLVGCFITFI